jgi:hypothetical protein
MNWPWAAAAQAYSVWSSWIATLPPDATSTATWSTSGTSASQRLRTQVRSLSGPAAAQALAASLERAVGATASWSTSTSAAPECDETGAGSGAPSKNASLFAAGALPIAAGEAIRVAMEARIGHPAIPQGDVAQVISHAFGGAVASVAPDATAFPHRNATLLSQFLSGSTDARALANAAWVEDLRDSLQPLYAGGAYLNYPDERLADWRSAYWGANLARLSKVKSTYDPDRVFRGRQFV